MFYVKFCTDLMKVTFNEGFSINRGVEIFSLRALVLFYDILKVIHNIATALYISLTFLFVRWERKSKTDCYEFREFLQVLNPLMMCLNSVIAFRRSLKIYSILLANVVIKDLSKLTVWESDSVFVYALHVLLKTRL